MTDRISEIILGAGIKDFGICGFSAVSERLIDCRAASRIPNGAKSIIVAVFPYSVKQEAPANISRYAAVADYHNVCTDMLKRAAFELSRQFDNRFEVFCDNSPIPEVLAANAAGLGVIGKNGLLITKKYGSFVFIGEIVTDLILPAGEKAGVCADCGRCKEACPVGLDKSRCLSEISQKKGNLSQSEAELIADSGCVWGCDICSQVCPYNKSRQQTYIEEFINTYRDSYSSGEDINGRAYNWRGKDIIKRNYDIINKHR